MKSTKKVEWEFLGGWLYQKILPAGILKVQKQILLEGQDGDGMYRVGVFGEYYGQCKDPESGKRIAEDRAREILLDSLSALGFQEWIPVGEMLPGECEIVNVRLKDGEDGIGSYTIIGDRPAWDVATSGLIEGLEIRVDLYNSVTHWSERPALQEGGGE